MKNKSRKKKGAVPKINPLKVLTSIPGLIKGVIGIIVIVLIVFVIKKGFFDSKEGEVTTISQSSIEKILDISELSTLEYTYNAVAAGYDEDGKTLLYHVAYEGTVSAGIDFDKLKVKVNPDKKEIRITVPEAKILDCSVNEGSLKYIFEKDEYNTATISADAYKVSKEDLKKKANEETRITELAKENAISAISGLIEPWVDQVDDEYTVIIIGILLISLLSGCGKSEDKEAAKSTEPDIMQVRSICKLATVECYYHNVAKSEKPAGTGIWHFGEKDRQFWIEYTGTVKLGIDMSKVQMKVNGTDVTVTIPEAEVQQVNVDDDSYNSDSYIFSEDGINKNEITAEDATGAVENARNEMIKTAEENTALLVNAQERAKKMIENYIMQLGETTGTEYQITWKYE